jgi:protein-glutamine gamma-glutamyltransferase
LPVLLAQMMCVEGRVPMTALFRYLRKLKARGERIRNPRVDLTGPYLALTLISAGMANKPGNGYFIGIVLIVAAALLRIRPSRVPIIAWSAALMISVSMGFAVQSGLYNLQTLIEDWIIDLQVGTPLLDPYRSSTGLGELGRLKKEDAIIMRVYAPREGGGKPALLHRASYNQYAGTTWLARHGTLEALPGSGDGTVFALPGQGGAAVQQASLRMSQRVQGGRTLLGLPLNSSAVSDLVASRVRSNALGAVQAEMEVPWTFYTTLYSRAPASAPPGYSGAGGDDLHVPAKERPTLNAVATELGLAGLAPAEAVRQIEGYFTGFEYTTVRNHPFSELVPGSETPVAEFLNSTRRGHCEYFATATTLLLRTAGIPARYATGYAVQDWSTWENAWIVRERHSHAWARAFVDGRWIEVDTTPAAWFGEEESLAPFGQRLADFLRWAGFRWSTRDGSETRILAWSIVALAALILVWKLVTEGGLVRLAERANKTAVGRPGSDSEFYAVEARLSKVVPRSSSEPLMDWLPRAAAQFEAATRCELAAMANLHYRYRFDPQGLDWHERDRLAKTCSRLLIGLRPA